MDAFLCIKIITQVDSINTLGAANFILIYTLIIVPVLRPILFSMYYASRQVTEHCTSLSATCASGAASISIAVGVLGNQITAEQRPRRAEAW